MIIDGNDLAQPAPPGVLDRVAARLDEVPAPSPTGVTRVCSFCLTRRDLADLVEQADTMVCADIAACSVRAQASGVYPAAESELAVAAREVKAGAL